MKEFTATHKTVIVCVLIVVLAAMSYFELSFDSVGLLAILGGLGWIITKQGENTAATQAVQENTNGNMTKLLTLVERQTEILSRLPALPPEPARDDDTNTRRTEL